MAASTPGAEVIPQYLQWKIESKRTDFNWDEKLEEANKVLHNRILKMREEKLCAGCARFITGDHGFERSLLAFPQDMSCSELQVKLGSREEVCSLAEEPRFTWEIVLGESISCVLCKVPLEAALTLLRESVELESRRLSVGIRLTDKMALGDETMINVSHPFVIMITG